MGYNSGNGMKGMLKMNATDYNRIMKVLVEGLETFDVSYNGCELLVKQHDKEGIVGVEPKYHDKKISFHRRSFPKAAFILFLKDVINCFEKNKIDLMIEVGNMEEDLTEREVGSVVNGIPTGPKSEKILSLYNELPIERSAYAIDEFKLSKKVYDNGEIIIKHVFDETPKLLLLFKGRQEYTIDRYRDCLVEITSKVDYEHFLKISNEKKELLKKVEEDLLSYLGRCHPSVKARYKIALDAYDNKLISFENGEDGEVYHSKMMNYLTNNDGEKLGAMMKERLGIESEYAYQKESFLKRIKERMPIVFFEDNKMVYFGFKSNQFQLFQMIKQNEFNDDFDVRYRVRYDGEFRDFDTLEEIEDYYTPVFENEYNKLRLKISVESINYYLPRFLNEMDIRGLGRILLNIQNDENIDLKAILSSFYQNGGEAKPVDDTFVIGNITFKKKNHGLSVSSTKEVQVS